MSLVDVDGLIVIQIDRSSDHVLISYRPINQIIELGVTQIGLPRF